MKHWSRAACLAVLALCAGAPAAAAAADASDDVVRSLEIEAELDAAGSLHVTETYEWDFGGREGLGFSRNILQRMDWEPDGSLVRLLEISEVEVSSPSGAPAEVWVEGDGRYLELAIGAPDGTEDTRSGVQTYVLSYTIDGAVNAIRDQDVADQDELYWNATGHESVVPLEEVRVSITGPGPATGAACFSGPVSAVDDCAALEQSGPDVVVANGPLEPGAGLTVAVAYPPGTFSEPGPILQDRVIASLGGDQDLTAGQQAIARVSDPVVSALVTFWPLTLLAVLAVMVMGVWRRRHLHRDFQFAGLTPGVLPPPGQDAHYSAERRARLGADGRLHPAGRAEPGRGQLPLAQGRARRAAVGHTRGPRRPGTSGHHRGRDRQSRPGDRLDADPGHVARPGHQGAGVPRGIPAARTVHRGLLRGRGRVPHRAGSRA